MADLQPTAVDGLPWGEIVPSFVKYGAQVYQKGPLIHNLWRQLQLQVEKKAPIMEPYTNIAILGPENAGKSVLNHALQARIRELSFSLPEASDDTERDLITIGKWTKVVSVLPGEDIEEKDKWLQKVFDTKGNLQGVIFVSNWGLSKPRSEAVQKQWMNEGVDLKELRRRRLTAEANEFRRVCIRIRELYNSKKQKIWLIIAAAKADLFFSTLEEAEWFYSFEVDRGSSSDFGDVPSLMSIYTNEIAQRVGSDHVPAMSVPVSSFVENFEWNGEQIVGAIGDEARSALLNHLVAVMNKQSPS